MNCDQLFSDELNLLYANAPVRSAKAGALREAVRDVSFVYELRKWFVVHGGGEVSASAFTVRAIVELIDQGWVQLAAWGPDNTAQTLEASAAQLMNIVEDTSTSPFEHFLVATQKGEEWLARYEALHGELHPEPTGHPATNFTPGPALE